MALTYRALTLPVPLKWSIANVGSQPASQSCDFCRLVLPDRSKSKNGTINTCYERYDSFPEFPALRLSAQAGCGLCRFLRKSVRQAWAVRPMEEWGVGPLEPHDEMMTSKWDGTVVLSNVSFALESPAQPALGGTESDNEAYEVVTRMSLEFGPVIPTEQDEGIRLHGKISQVVSFKVFDSVGMSPGCTGSDSRSLPLLLTRMTSEDLHRPHAQKRRRLPSVETLSEDNLRMMQGWIQDCERSHPECQRNRLSPVSRAASADFHDDWWLPARLLCVRETGTDTVRIVETKVEFADRYRRDPVRYAALSHMWGDVETAPPLRAMRFNYHQMLNAIFVAELPKNFRDAMVVCRRLGIDYIWIDSLCIIQDDPEDWKRQAALMHRVYRLACVTLVA
jgi:hypothetical protein